MKMLNNIKTGDTVKVANAYFKNDNGLYFVEHSAGDVSWNGSEYCLKKICKNGKISIADNNICFWPISSFVSSREKRIAAKKHNEENATIEKVENIDKSFIAEYFENEAEGMEKQTRHDIYNYGEESQTVKEEQATVNFYKSVIKELKEEQPELEPPAPPTEPKQTAKPATVAENATVEKSAIVQNEVKESQPKAEGTTESNSSYETFKKYEVEATSINDFLKRYSKQFILDRGQEHHEARVKSCQEDIAKYGFTFITHHNSKTGENVAYYKKDTPPKPQPEDITLQPPKEPQTEPTKIIATYSTISEETARRAKEMNSFSDYKAGSATSSYKSQVDEVAKIAQDKADRYPDETETIQNLLDRYSQKLAEWNNKYYSIECRCPSMLITGAGNFPTARKNKQNAARESHMKEYSKIEYIIDKINKIGAGPIKSSDDKAIEKLQNKLDKLLQQREDIKAHNKKARAEGTQQAPTYMLQNLGQNIRATQNRLDTLKKAKETSTEEKTTEYNSTICKVVENTDIMRIQLIFDGKPDEETRKILKSNGFRYAPSQTAWQRQLTSNGKYATKCVIEKLEQTA